MARRQPSAASACAVAFPNPWLEADGANPPESKLRDERGIRLVRSLNHVAYEELISYAQPAGAPFRTETLGGHPCWTSTTWALTAESFVREITLLRRAGFLFPGQRVWVANGGSGAFLLPELETGLPAEAEGAVREALQARDMVLLADLVRYELAPLAEQWHALSTELAGQLASPVASN